MQEPLAGFNLEAWRGPEDQEVRELLQEDRRWEVLAGGAHRET